tara:strand:+ start:813 stop:1049 length:237 start_codon:yes stop_codon:yes gene_type:complete
MHRGYVLTNLEMDSVVSVNVKNKNFDLLPIDNRSVLNKAICFTNRTAAKTIQEKIIESFPDFPTTKVVNVAQLYNKVF